MHNLVVEGSERMFGTVIIDAYKKEKLGYSIFVQSLLLQSITHRNEK